MQAMTNLPVFRRGSSAAASLFAVIARRPAIDPDGPGRVLEAVRALPLSCRSWRASALLPDTRQPVWCPSIDPEGLGHMAEVVGAALAGGRVRQLLKGMVELAAAAGRLAGWLIDRIIQRS